MLASWRLSKFKSVTKEIELSLAPLTLFTGANSAGKSTIIQSILLTAQTLQSSVFSRPVVLNGHMTRLGSFSDIVSYSDENEYITIGFELNGLLHENSLSGTHTRLWRSGAYLRRGGAIEAVSASYSFCVKPGPNEALDKDLLKLQPSLLESAVSVRYKGDQKVETDSLFVKRSAEPVSQRLAELKIHGGESQGPAIESLKYLVARPAKAAQQGRLASLGISSEVAGVYLNHFLPKALSIRFDQVAASVASQLAMIVEPNQYRYFTTFVVDNDEVPNSVVERIEQTLAPILAEPDLANSTRHWIERAVHAIKNHDLKGFSECLRRCLSRDVARIYTALGSEKAVLQQLLRNNRSAVYDLEVQPPNEMISVGIDYISNFFGRSVKYLGPLRDEPKPVYPLAGASDPGDVGFRGEHTAAVLDIQKNTTVVYIPSNHFRDDDAAFAPASISLADAVRDWLEYMGVGTAFQTSDLGKLGHELKVQTQGSVLSHDLTQVGVGVSQVLPILVLALLADSGSTLVFEQPELHLHPKVQSRLADFFVSMTRLGKQCIVETHSEYLINRLRYRSASAEADDVAKDVMIYFVEKEDGASIYRRVRIDELGSLDVWPAGFFDEGENATAALLRRSLKKRRDGGGRG